MMAASHAASGVAAGLAVGVHASNPLVGLGCGMVGLLASYAPDLDHPESTAVRLLWWPGRLLCRLLRAVSQAATGRAHRGLTHSLLFAVVVGIAVGAATGVDVFGWAAFAGVCAALVGDAVTRAGLSHLLWPLGLRLRLPRLLAIKTGGRLERWIILPLLTLACMAGVGAVLWTWIVGVPPWA